ncbi:hypothetical protein HN451_07570, partial [archaeon]|nr:hypothetical protein [archaeon]
MRRKEFLLIGIFLLISSIVFARPPVATEFYGLAQIDDGNYTNLPLGTSIEAFAGNVSCGSFTMSNPGYYGLTSCMGDDNYTATDEGAIYGQNIIFTINGDAAATTGDTVWYTGEFHEVNLVTIPRCGNTFCEITESCSTCLQDCGPCPTNVTPTNNTGGGGGGDGTGGTAPPSTSTTPSGGASGGGGGGGDADGGEGGIG